MEIPGTVRTAWRWLSTGILAAVVGALLVTLVVAVMTMLRFTGR
ncbi:MAG: hypothetical protein JWN00_5794 [Actinomycetia bacterium]|nr:hypothetical protein [Actinomycetes bacterium]